MKPIELNLYFRSPLKFSTLLILAPLLFTISMHCKHNLTHIILYIIFSTKQTLPSQPTGKTETSFFSPLLLHVETFQFHSDHCTVQTYIWKINSASF